MFRFVLTPAFSGVFGYADEAYAKYESGSGQTYPQIRSRMISFEKIGPVVISMNLNSASKAETRA